MIPHITIVHHSRLIDSQRYCAKINGTDFYHGGTGATPEEALLNAARHWYRTEQIKKRENVDEDMKTLMTILIDKPKET